MTAVSVIPSTAFLFRRARFLFTMPSTTLSFAVFYCKPFPLFFQESDGNFYKKSGFSPLKHQMRFMSLLASPFLLCAMVLVAAVFALRPNMRKGGVMILIVGGVASGFGVYFASQVIYAFGLNGYIPSIMAVWTPILITALVSISALLKLEDG